MLTEGASLTLAIVGRPNVGKSTLFNRLVGKKLAIVHDSPGVTRDWRTAPGMVAGIPLTVIDTAGLEETFDDSLEGRMRHKTEQAIRQADVVLMVIDARVGVTPLDRHFADWLRRQDVPVIVLANKSEGRVGGAGYLDAYELGLGDPIPFSAEHGEGMSDLVEALQPHFKVKPDDEEEPKEEGEDDQRPLNLAIVGRPNAGKSTLMNGLLGEERVLTGPDAGTTRDAVTVNWIYKDQPIRLVDTAGLRRKSKIDEKLEKLAVDDTLRAIRLAHVVVLVLDGLAILDNQDLTIARLVIEEGRGLVIAVNKWDAVENKVDAIKRLKDRLEASLPQVRGVPTVMISALRGQKLNYLMDAVLTTYQLWNKRISTAHLNRWLREAVDSHPPPLSEGRRIKIRYVTQVKARPPTFAMWVSKPVDLPETYSRYLITSLREIFKLPGVPIRFVIRKGENPYAEE